MSKTQRILFREDEQNNKSIPLVSSFLFQFLFELGFKKGHRQTNEEQARQHIKASLSAVEARPPHLLQR